MWFSGTVESERDGVVRSLRSMFVFPEVEKEINRRSFFSRLLAGLAFLPFLRQRETFAIDTPRTRGLYLQVTLAADGVNIHTVSMKRRGPDGVWREIPVSPARTERFPGVTYAICEVKGVGPVTWKG